ncbi:hypothetical protein CLAIMM_15111 [Cladophialophora immunda]|nr:hypothetical protein CLAIMM_15111 [Cladophialophora immunda]
MKTDNVMDIEEHGQKTRKERHKRRTLVSRARSFYQHTVYYENVVTHLSQGDYHDNHLLHPKVKSLAGQDCDRPRDHHL